MRYRIQTLVLPSEEKHRQSRELFYRGDYGAVDTEQHRLMLGRGQFCDFCTYLNACSWRKWKEYTSAQQVTLHLEVEGEFDLILVGYHKDGLTMERVELGREHYRETKRREISFELPENDEQMVGFEIATWEDCVIYEGYFTVEVEKKSMQEVRLALATTTCHKEEFIKKNVQLLKSDLLTGKDEVARNLFIHVVDNGRSLRPEEMVDKQVFLHPNINAGGSGGFARGMLEALAQKPQITHVLLMDDDVLVLPESIRRTYALLRLLKPEFRDYFVSGAMLYYEKPDYQHEDVGSLTFTEHDFWFSSAKGRLKQTKVKNCLKSEYEPVTVQRPYAAWWYCCVPRQVIEAQGLPLPFFIRIDDMEYALRRQAKFLTWNGICVWHMGFTTKYNAAFDLYQAIRNLSVMGAVDQNMSEVDMLAIVYNRFRIEMLQFSYRAAELTLLALEDYLRGPEWLMGLDPEENLAKVLAYNDQLEPLEEVAPGVKVEGEKVWDDQWQKWLDRVLLKLTWNGQRWTPKWLEREGVVPISFDGEIQPNKIVLHSRLLAVNPFINTGVYRVKDKTKFRELMKRWQALEKDYRKRGAEVAEAYRQAQPEMVSEKFWRKYLGLNS